MVERLLIRGIASIFKRNSEPLAVQKFEGLADFSQTYKKYTVQRKIAIGRHERVMAIDGDYIHVSTRSTWLIPMPASLYHLTMPGTYPTSPILCRLDMQSAMLIVTLSSDPAF